MNPNGNELDIPPKAKADTDSQEVLRVWIADGNSHVCLLHDICEDPGAWGLILVDIARHVANAYDHEGTKHFNEVLNRIKWGFDTEWNNPTDTPKGKLEDR